LMCSVMSVHHSRFQCVGDEAALHEIVVHCRRGPEPAS
jgi:hypothetical protein